MSKIAWFLGLISLGGHRAFGRLIRQHDRRTVLSILGVALAVGLMLTVTGTSLGLAEQNTIYGSGVDYWLVPKSASASTLPVSVGGAQFGHVHAASRQIGAYGSVQYASPVSLKVVNLSTANSSAYVLVAGVVAHQGVSIAGLNTSQLTPGDPHYANGTYSGGWTDEMVLSSGAASLLNTTQGGRVIFPPGHTTNTTRNLTVVGVQTGSTTGAGSLPIAIMHLSELQSLTGTAQGDTASRILVGTNNPGIRSKLTGIYPDSTLVSGSGQSFHAITQSKLALAIALTAFLVALVIGTLFVATAMGLEVTADRRQYATLAAIGLSHRSQLIALATQTVIVTVIGGVIGVGLGVAGITTANQIATSTLGTGQIAVFTPRLGLYGLIVAIVIGFLTVPYLGWLLSRTSILEGLRA